MITFVEVSKVFSQEVHVYYFILFHCLSISDSLHFTGTGHGVGAALNVHEGPHSVSRVLNPQPLVAGMVVSK